MLTPDLLLEATEEALAMWGGEEEGGLAPRPLAGDTDPVADVPSSTSPSSSLSYTDNKEVGRADRHARNANTFRDPC